MLDRQKGKAQPITSLERPLPIYHWYALGNRPTTTKPLPCEGINKGLEAPLLKNKDHVSLQHIKALTSRLYAIFSLTYT